MGHEFLKVELVEQLVLLVADYRKRAYKKLFKQFDGTTITKYLSSTGFGAYGQEGMPTFNAVLSNDSKAVLRVSIVEEGSVAGHLLGLKPPRKNKKLTYMEKLIVAHGSLKES